MDPATRARLEAEKAQQAAIAKATAEVEAALKTGDLDLAITKYTEAAAALPGMRDLLRADRRSADEEGSFAEAEKAYLEAIKIDDQNSEAYNALTNIYNAQRKFDEAAKMSAKFNALAATSGGGGNAESLFNQGAIAFNQNKIAEAKPFLEKAIALKPDLAEAHYLLRHGAHQRRQGRRGQEVAGRVPETRADRAERRRRRRPSSTHRSDVAP